MNREHTYRKELYELQQREELEKEKDWLAAFPINEMKKIGLAARYKRKARFGGQSGAKILLHCKHRRMGTHLHCRRSFGCI